jgi:hypothetical protein
MEWPMDEAVPVKQCLQVYKSAFLLNSLNNSGFGQLIIPALKFLTLFFYVNVTAFTVFCYWEKVDILPILMLTALFLTSASAIGVCSLVMSSIYNISSQFQRNMKQKIRVSEEKGIREIRIRELRSCQLVRCQIGSFYHMEGKAKLTLANTMVNCFVFMIVQHKMQ